MKKGETERALQLAEEGLKKYELTEAQKAELNRVAAEVLTRKGELKRAKNYAEKARSHAIASGDYRIVYGVAVALGNIFARMNNYAAADMAYNEALTLAGIHKDTSLEAPALLNMAQIDQHRGNHVRALDILNKVHGRLEKAKKQRLLAVCCSRMAFSYMEENRLDEALASVKELEEIAEQKDDKNLMASAHFRRGSILLNQEEFSKALTGFRKASRLFKELGDNKNLALTLCNLAIAHRCLGKFKEVESLLKEASNLAEEIASPTISHAITLTNAEIAAYKGDKKTAARYYQNALDFAEEIDNVDRFQSVHQSFRSAINKVGLKLPGLKNLLERAHNNYIRLGLKREAEETQRWLAQISLTE